MATVLDALVVSLNLDASGFSRSATKTRTDLKQIGAAGDATAKDIGNAAKQMAASINHVRTEVLALFTAFTAGRGIKQMVSEITDGDAATGRLARSVGMATGELAVLQEAAKRVGGTAEGVGASIAGLSAKFTEFRETGQGGESWVPVLQRMGVALVDDTGKMKSFTRLFSDLAGWSENKSPQQSGYWLSQLGLDPGTIRLVQEGRAGMQRSLAEARSLGVASDKDAANAQELLANIANVRQAIDDVVRVVLREFGPAINQALAQFTTWIVTNGPKLKTEIADRITWIVSEVRSFVESADRASTAVGGWVKVSEALFALWAASKVAGLIGAVAKVGGLFVGGGVAAAGGAAAVARLAPALAPLALIGPAGGEDPEFSERKNQEYLRNHPRNRQTDPTGTPATGSRRDQDDFIDRLSRAIGRFLGHETTMDTGSGPEGATPGEALRAGARSQVSPTQQIGAANTTLPGGGNKSAFVSRYGTAAQEMARLTGTDAQFWLGQWGNETGWGRAVAGNNLGNIKPGTGWRGQTVTQADGQAYRAYASPEDFARDAAGLIQRRYPGALNRGSDYEGAARGLKQGGYAEDPDYVGKTTRAARSLGNVGAGAGPLYGTPPPTLQPQKVSALRWGNTTNNSTADNSSSVENHIGQVVVNTRAQNGREVAGSIKNYLADMTYTDSRRALS